MRPSLLCRGSALREMGDLLYTSAGTVPRGTGNRSLQRRAEGYLPIRRFVIIRGR